VGPPWFRQVFVGHQALLSLCLRDVIQRGLKVRRQLGHRHPLLSGPVAPRFSTGPLLRRFSYAAFSATTIMCVPASTRDFDASTSHSSSSAHCAGSLRAIASATGLFAAREFDADMTTMRKP